LRTFGFGGLVLMALAVPAANLPVLAALLLVSGGAGIGYAAALNRTGLRGRHQARYRPFDRFKGPLVAEHVAGKDGLPSTYQRHGAGSEWMPVWLRNCTDQEIRILRIKVEPLKQPMEFVEDPNKPFGQLTVGEVVMLGGTRQPAQVTIAPHRLALGKVIGDKARLLMEISFQTQGCPERLMRLYIEPDDSGPARVVRKVIDP